MTVQNITIFEGPDGSGKSTAAKRYAAETGARYVHLGPFKGITQGLGRFYVEAMLPALLGYQAVVLDRSWHSELIYGMVYRDGQDRLGQNGRRALDRLALKANALLVMCQPGLDTVLECFRSRKGDEMLESEAQLESVWWQYNAWRDSQLPTLFYDRDHSSVDGALEAINAYRQTTKGLSLPPAHWTMAGRLLAPVLVIGDTASEHKRNDSLYQWPFGSMSSPGCSLWLNDQLWDQPIRELDLCWVNAADATTDELATLLHCIGRKATFVLGDEAAKLLGSFPTSRYTKVPHPQYWMRFKAGLDYPLITALKELDLNG